MRLQVIEVLKDIAGSYEALPIIKSLLLVFTMEHTRSFKPYALLYSKPLDASCAHSTPEIFLIYLGTFLGNAKFA